MAERILYPKPDCPECDKSTTYVKNTYYTDDGNILRHRKCDFCGESHWTLQAPEALFPESWRLEFPKKFSRTTRDRKQITIVKPEQ